MGGLFPTALVPLACALPCAPGAVSDDVGVGVVDVALLSAGTELEGVDEATTVSIVDVAAAAIATTVVDDAAAIVDVAATCARTGLTIANPMARATTSALVLMNVMMLAFMLLKII